MKQWYALYDYVLKGILISIAEADGAGYLQNIMNHPLIQCRLKGGQCMHINTCNTTVNIYKDICKAYNYHDVCCISRVTVCQKFSGFCTNNSNTCLMAGALFRGGYGSQYKPVVFSWLGCNSTHRCCHPISIKKSRPKGYGGGGHGGGGYGGGGGHGGGGYGGGGGHGGGGYGGGGGHGGGGYGGGGGGHGGGGYGGGGGHGGGGYGGGGGHGGGGYGGGGGHGGGGYGGGGGGGYGGHGIIDEGHYQGRFIDYGSSGHGGGYGHG